MNTANSPIGRISAEGTVTMYPASVLTTFPGGAAGSPTSDGDLSIAPVIESPRARHARKS